MTRRVAVLVVVLAVVLAIALAVDTPAVAAQDVTADWDKTATFALYATHAWAPENRPPPGTTLLYDRIVHAVDVQLQLKGLRRQDEGADVVLAAHAVTQDRALLNSFYANWGTTWDWGGLTPTTGIINELTRGTLIVDMIDARTRKLVWRGSATRSLSNNPEKNEKNITDAIEKMFKKLPPMGASTRDMP